MDKDFLPAPKNSPVSGNVLKLFAAVTMLIDHIGYVLFPQYRFLRAIGRLAFPIFIFLLVEGFFYTRSRKIHMLRLILLCPVCEIAFDLAFYGQFNYPMKSNVFLTLGIGFIVMALLDFMFTVDTTTFRFPALVYGAFIGVIACIALADMLHTDYGSYGVLAIGAAYVAKKFDMHRIIIIMVIVGILCVLNNFEVWAVFDLIPIWLYNGTVGKKHPAIQYGFYLFYPLHLFVLYFIRKYLFL